MRPDSATTAIYLHRIPVDFHKAVDGLAAIVEAEMKMVQPGNLTGESAFRTSAVGIAAYYDTPAVPSRHLIFNGDESYLLAVRHKPDR